MNELTKDLSRINSINTGTPGHEWFGRSSTSSRETQEIDPGKLDLNNVEDFLKFVDALSQGETRSLDFLKRIPSTRIEELKEKHVQLSAFFPALDQ